MNPPAADVAERGGATNVQLAILWIALLLMIVSVVQVALLFYAGQLAHTAAQDGLRSGRYYDVVSPERARADAEAFLAKAAGTTLQAARVTADLDDTGATLRVTVSGQALSLIPGVPLAVSKQAAGAVERVAP